MEFKVILLKCYAKCVEAHVAQSIQMMFNL